MLIQGKLLLLSILLTLGSCSSTSVLEKESTLASIDLNVYCATFATAATAAYQYSEAYKQQWSIVAINHLGAAYRLGSTEEYNESQFNFLNEKLQKSALLNKIPEYEISYKMNLLYYKYKCDDLYRIITPLKNQKKAVQNEL